VDPLSESAHLLPELRSEFGVLHLLEVLKLTLVLHRTYHREAVTVLEELLDHAADSVLLFHRVAVALLWLQRIFQVVPLTDGVARQVDQAQAEVAHHPQKGGEVFLDFVGVALAEHFGLDLQFLRKIDDEAQRVDGIFVDGVHGVENETRAEQESQQEYLGVVVHVLVKGTDAFAVHDENSELLAIVLAFDGLAPDPEAFGAGIDCRSYSEARALFIKDDSVEQEGLASPVLACHCDDSYLLLNTS
jgi:hypothetical protein